MPFQKRIIVMAFLFGVLAFGMVSQHPEFASFRALDIFELLFSGWCFGVGSIILIVNLKAKPHK
jgi:hypothetical protein